ncbi:hypothetical protein PanWU01x14_323750 [Parasponia andersonii]|uniref:Uncharacterized protein n=1 Tax=Parasponia andersonii TaxID=3476 RepID=A0A2P5AKA7_PARAD|nr:hypothetical protein PanWU01x14_323750 [Parasponia andersonii]
MAKAGIQVHQTSRTFKNGRKVILDVSFKNGMAVAAVIGIDEDYEVKILFTCNENASSPKKRNSRARCWRYKSAPQLDDAGLYTVDWTPQSQNVTAHEMAKWAFSLKISRNFKV